MKHFLMLITVLSGIVLNTSHSVAYYIDTGLSNPCHEKLTAELLVQFMQETSLDAEQNVPLPDSNLWEMYSDAILANFDIKVENRNEKYVIASLMIGTRWPDEHGRSVTSLEALYSTHGDPSDQHEHFLRHPHHDYTDGNVAAIEEAKTFLSKRTRLALAYLKSEKDSQIIELTEYVEFYGQIKFKLWAPAFYLGTAIHTLQDSFSHTVRSDDLTHILHVMNFIDAVTEDFKEHKDGLAHSYGMDYCSPQNKPLTDESQRATYEMILMLETGDFEDFEIIMQTWFQHRDGCTIENKFCNTKWYDNITSDPTDPIVGCQMASTSISSPSLFQFLFNLF